jgi:hypothetical protein
MDGSWDPKARFHAKYYTKNIKSREDHEITYLPLEK